MSLLVDIPAAEYHSSGRLGSTLLADYIESPRLYELRLRVPREDTPAMRLGRALHCATLEPNRYLATYAMRPKVDRRTRAGREAVEAWSRDGLETISEADHALIEGMIASMAAHPAARRILEYPSIREGSMYWTDPTGIDCQARPDIWSCEGEGHDVTIVDLKSTSDSSRRAWEREIERLYWIQAAHYEAGVLSHGLNLSAWVWLCVDTTRPHDVAVYYFDEASRARCRVAYRSAMDSLAECRKTGVFSHPNETVQPIGLPRWSDL